MEKQERTVNDRIIMLNLEIEGLHKEIQSLREQISWLASKIAVL